MKIQYGSFKILVFVIIILSCKSKKIEQQISQSHLDSLSQNTKGEYAEFLERNIIYNITSYDNEFIKKSIDFLNNRFVLLFVATENDCSTCVNQEITLILKNIKDKINHVYIVSDSSGFKRMNHEWEAVLSRFNRITLDKETIVTKLGYVHKPFYMLVEKKQGVVCRYLVDPQYPLMTNKILHTIRTGFF